MCVGVGGERNGVECVFVCVCDSMCVFLWDMKTERLIPLSHVM